MYNSIVFNTIRLLHSSSLSTDTKALVPLSCLYSSFLVLLTTERTESTLDYNSHFLNHTYRTLYYALQVLYPAHSYGQFKITN